MNIIKLFCRPSHDPVEDELDSLTNMLQEALKTGSQDSLNGKSTEESASSSQSSFIDHGSTEGNEPSQLQMFRSRLRSDSGNESLSSDVSPTPSVEGTLFKLERFLRLCASLSSSYICSCQLSVGLLQSTLLLQC